MMEQRSQPGRGPTQPDDRKNYDAGGVFAQICSVLINGLPFAARFKTSLRVGSGSAALAAFDGTDGQIIADGALAIFRARDRADSTKHVYLYRNGTVRIGVETGDLWLIDPTTGQLTQPAWVAATLGNSWANSAGWQPAAYFKDTNGIVHLRGGITGGTTGTTAFFLGVGFRPAVQSLHPIFGQTVGGAAYQAGAFVTISAAGAVNINVVPTGGNAWLDGISFDTR
jgi:hypothetical protein